MKTNQLQAKTTEIVSRLAKLYPNPQTALVHTNAFELLVATILSAQSTDKQVNIVTPQFFPKYNSPEKLLKLGQEQFQTMIKSINLNPTKGKNIFALCKILVDQHQGKVPNTREELEALPGVGRKTANVVLANAFNMPAFAVDTHVFRVTKRLGLTKGATPLIVEQDVTKLIPEELWSTAHHYFIFHGREICKAIKPKCKECVLVDLCPSKQINN